MYIIKILRYGSAELGYLFGVYDDLDKAIEDAKEYNDFRGKKYPRIIVYEFELNTGMPFENKSYIVDLEERA